MADSDLGHTGDVGEKGTCLMRFLFSIFLLVLLASCCRIDEMPTLQKVSKPESVSELFQFRLERSGKTKLSGLLAIKQQENGIWNGLLDATGIPLVKMLVGADGSKHLEYCSKAVCDTKLPEILGKLVDYIYFMPANAECPWYAFSCICEESENGQISTKWKKFGPLSVWKVDHLTTPGNKEKIEVRMYFSSVKVHLQRIDSSTKN